MEVNCQVRASRSYDDIVPYCSPPTDVDVPFPSYLIPLRNKYLLSIRLHIHMMTSNPSTMLSQAQAVDLTFSVGSLYITILQSREHTLLVGQQMHNVALYRQDLEAAGCRGRGA